MTCTKQIPPRLLEEHVHKGPPGNGSWVFQRYSHRDSFYGRWNAGIRNDVREISVFHEYWEREELLEEVHKKEAWLQKPENDLIFNEGDLDQLLKEVAAYANRLNQVVQLNRTLDGVIQAVKSASSAVRGSAHGTLIQPRLETYATRLEEIRIDLTRLRQNYWASEYCGSSLTSAPPELWFPPVKQERNLDTLFQIRAGWVLRIIRPRLTLRSVARLVVLTYIAAGLVSEQAGHLIVWGSNPARKLLVSAISDNLSLHKLGQVHGNHSRSNSLFAIPGRSCKI